MGTITIGGLATGLDTDKIVTQLVALERQRGIGALETQKTNATARQIALQTLNTKVLAFLTATEKLKTSDALLVTKAASSNATVLTATTVTGAQTGNTSVTVSQLARSAIAAAANGLPTSTSTVASGSGSFAFRVGTGAVQTVAIDATTTLDGLASAINALAAGATASVVNVGTAAAPSFRLRLESDQTGTASAVSIVTDGTTLGVSVTQTASNSTFTVGGFSGSITRETNTVSDVIPGVTLNLLSTSGTAVDVTVTTDGDGAAALADAAVKAFNDLVTFVASESAITQDTSSDERDVTIGPLALDGTVRSILQSLRSRVSDQVSGLSGSYTLLAQVGITTNRDGTLAFDQAKFKTELGLDDTDVGALFGGTGAIGGVADRLADYLKGITQAGGLIDVHTKAVGEEISTLDERIAAGQRNLDAFEDNLRAQFVSLEILVNSLQAQGSFFAQALGSQS